MLWLFSAALWVASGSFPFPLPPQPPLLVCALWFPPSRQSCTATHLTRLGCARPQPFLLPDFSLHLFTTPTSNWAGEQTENSWHSVIKKFECFKMSQNCCPHVLEQKYQLPDSHSAFHHLLPPCPWLPRQSTSVPGKPEPQKAAFIGFQQPHNHPLWSLPGQHQPPLDHWRWEILRKLLLRTTAAGQMSSPHFPSLPSYRVSIYIYLSIRMYIYMGGCLRSANTWQAPHGSPGSLLQTCLLHRGHVSLLQGSRESCAALAAWLPALEPLGQQLQVAPGRRATRWGAPKSSTTLSFHLKVKRCVFNRLKTT